MESLEKPRPVAASTGRTWRTQRAYAVRCIKSVDALKSVREDWHRLYDANPHLFHFQSYEWNHGLLAHGAVPGATRIWLLYRDGNPVLIAPMMRVRHGLLPELVFVGHDTHADYLDFVYDELTADDLSHLVRHIIAESPGCVVTFAYMNERSRAAVLLEALALHRRLTTGLCFSISLPTTTDAYIASLGKSTRKEIKSGINRLTTKYPGYRFQYSAKQQLAPTSVDAILEAYRKRLEHKGLAFRFSEAYAGFLRDYLANSKEIVLASLYLDESLAAFNLGILGRNGEIQVLIVSMDSYHRQMNVGNLLLYMTIRHLIEANKNGVERVKAYDLTRGDELYKRKYGATEHRIQNYSCARFWIVYVGLRLVVCARNVWKKLTERFFP